MCSRLARPAAARYAASSAKEALGDG